MKLKTENYEKFSVRAVALIGLLISFSIVAIFFYDTGRLENEPYGHTKHYTAHTDKQIARICSFADTKVAAIECAIDQKTTKRDAKRAEQDLNAQQKMAAWAWWMTIVTGATAIIAGFGVFFVWNDTREARRIGQAQARAYLAVSGIRPVERRNPVLLLGKDEKVINRIDKYIFQIINSGQTPALNVSAEITTNIEDWGRKTIRSIGQLGVGNHNIEVSMSAMRNALQNVNERRITFSVKLVYSDIFDSTKRIEVNEMLTKETGLNEAFERQHMLDDDESQY